MSEHNHDVGRLVASIEKMVSTFVKIVAVLLANDVVLFLAVAYLIYLQGR